MSKELNKRYAGKDYSEPGYYFITVKAINRKAIFGRVVGSSKVPMPEGREISLIYDRANMAADEGWPRMEFTTFGQKVYKEIWNMPKVGVCAGKFKIEQFQIMPDHIHFLFHITEKLPIHIGMLISSFYKGCRNAFREVYGIPLEVKERETHLLQNREADTSQQSYDPYGICSAANGYSIKLFEDGYNDWVVIKRGQLNAYFQYIKDNCRRLLLRKEHPNLFKKIWGKELLPGMRFNMLGNMFLLERPEKLQVRISRFIVEPSCLQNGLEPHHPTYSLPKRMKSETDIKNAIDAYLNHARKGAVLVTPSISPGEKAIVQAAYSEGLYVIRILLNGMSEVHKPDGASIDACSKGLLLELDPWGYDPTRKYTKANCEALNDIAGRLCQHNS